MHKGLKVLATLLVGIGPLAVLVNCSSSSSNDTPVMTPPVITAQTANPNVAVGAAYPALSVTVSSTANPAPTYQWYLESNKIDGATMASFTPDMTGQLGTNYGGTYSCAVISPAGSIASAPIVVNVVQTQTWTTDGASIYLSDLGATPGNDNLLGTTGVGPYSVDLALTNGNTLYAITQAGLSTLDTTTGAATATVPTVDGKGNPVTTMYCLAADGSGNLWGVERVSASLCSIDPVAGVVTTVGPLSQVSIPAGDMTFDGSGNCWIALYGDFVSGGVLATVDLGSGMATTQFTGLPTNISSMFFLNNLLYFIDYNGTNYELQYIDLTPVPATDTTPALPYGAGLPVKVRNMFVTAG